MVGHSRLRALLLGTFISLVALELLLRFGGACIRWADLQRNPHRSSADLRIVAIGESTTRNGLHLSYPAQLQVALQQALPELRVAVYNCGVPGVGSNELVEQLDSHLRTYAPQVVITMMGANDGGRAIPLTAVGDLPSDHLLGSLRLYRFVHYLLHFGRPLDVPALQPAPPLAVSHKHEATPLIHALEPGARQLVTSSETTSMHNQLSECIEPDPLDARPGCVSLRRARALPWSDAQQAIPLLVQAMREDPDDPRPYVDFAERQRHLAGELGSPTSTKLVETACERWPKEGSLWVAAGLLCASGSKEQQAHFARGRGTDYEHLGRHMLLVRQYLRYLAATGQDDEASRLLEVLTHCHPALVHGPLAQWYWTTRRQPQRAPAWLRSGTDTASNAQLPLTRTNLLRVYRRCHESGIQLVCASYATRSAASLRELFATHKDVLVVDNQEPFASIVAQGRYNDVFYDNCYTDFGHATAEGNHLLAANLASALSKLDLPRLARGKRGLSPR